MRKCSVEGCVKKHHARGYCSQHYDSIYLSSLNRIKLKVKQCPVCHFAEFYLGKEEWRDIPGFEGSHVVSSFGRVKSLDRTDCGGQKRNGFFLSISQENNGYLRYTVMKDRKSTTFLVHRLVMIVFGEDLGEKETVNHKDGHKYNNHYENLEWASLSEQQKHAHRTGLNHAVIGVDNPDSIRVYSIEKSTGRKISHGSIREASRYTGISKQSLLQWLHGKHAPSAKQKFTIHYEEQQ